MIASLKALVTTCMYEVVLEAAVSPVSIFILPWLLVDVLPLDIDSFAAPDFAGLLTEDMAVLLESLCGSELCVYGM